MKNIWSKCKITGKTFSSARGFLNHLRTLKMTSKEYYDKFHKTDDEGICYCGNPTSYHGFRYKKYCSDVCACKSEEHRKIVSQRFINNPQALETFRLSRKDVDTNIVKRKETIRMKCERLGISEQGYYSNHSKLAFSNMTQEQIDCRTLKAMETKSMSGNFGGRSGYKLYPFFDETLSLQGYEPVVLDCLIDDFALGKEDIISGKSDIPVIKYDDNRMYFPDFYLPNYNLLIEVKSEYTYNLHKETVHKKCQASIDSGYSIVLLIVTKHEARNCKLEGSKNLLHWAISSQAPNPTWYGEGSSTIPQGSREQVNGSRNAVTLSESVI